jgi:GTP cyclohydrolase I
METAVQSENIQALIRQLLIEIGEDPDREGLRETPARVARFYEEFINYDPGKITVFDNGHGLDNADQMIVVGPMRVWSLCEHHLLPFYADVIVGYIPNKTILGLSKFARIAHNHAHRLQVQERMVHNIAVDISKAVDTQDVAVTAYGEHLCMTMRGIKTPSKTVSSVVLGVFRESPAVRKEFFDLTRTLSHAIN